MSTTHTNTPAELLQKALVDDNAGTLPSSAGSWPIFVGHLPENPDNAVCIYDTSGNRDGRLMSTGEYMSHPGYQIRVRGTSHQVAYAKIKEIEDAISLFSMEPLTIDGDDYILHSVSTTGTIMSLGQENDRKRRVEFTLNGILTFTEE